MYLYCRFSVFLFTKQYFCDFFMNVSPVPVTIVTVSECCHAQIISTLYRIYLWNSYLFPNTAKLYYLSSYDASKSYTVGSLKIKSRPALFGAGRLYFIAWQELVLVEVYALEGNGYEAFCSAFKILTDSHLGIVDELLFHKA